MNPDAKLNKWMSRWGLWLGMIAVLATSTMAQTPTVTPTPSASPITTTTPSLERRFFANLLSDQRAIWSAPFHWQKRDARWLLPLGFSTAALIATDRYSAAAIETDPERANVSRKISRFGSLPVTGGIIAGFYLSGRVGQNYRARETGLLAAEAIINTQIVVQTLKVGTRRNRPLEGNKHGEPYEKDRAYKIIGGMVVISAVAERRPMIGANA